MTFQHLNRRVHLYLGLSLLPWFFIYGVSSIPFNHNRYFEDRDMAKGIPLWTKRFERSYDVPVPDGDLRPLGRKILDDTGLKGNYGVFRQNPRQINVYVYTFLQSTQVKYFPQEKRLLAEDRRFRFEHFLTGMHARGGFGQDTWLQNSWGVVVDIVSIAMLLWIASGVYMWWLLPATRKWGWLALGSGAGLFTFFLARL